MMTKMSQLSHRIYVTDIFIILKYKISKRVPKQACFISVCLRFIYCGHVCHDRNCVWSRGDGGYIHMAHSLVWYDFLEHNLDLGAGSET